MMDIHNEYLKGWLQANEKNKNVGKFIKELDKSVADENKNYYEYLDENIGDDASFSLKKKGYSYKKIADLYCCSWGTVYRRLYPFVEHKTT